MTSNLKYAMLYTILSLLGAGSAYLSGLFLFGSPVILAWIAALGWVLGLFATVFFGILAVCRLLDHLLRNGRYYAIANWFNSDS